MEVTGFNINQNQSFILLINIKIPTFMSKINFMLGTKGFVKMFMMHSHLNDLTMVILMAEYSV